jgi:hypothetical protein
MSTSAVKARRSPSASGDEASALGAVAAEADDMGSANASVGENVLVTAQRNGSANAAATIVASTDRAQGDDEEEDEGDEEEGDEHDGDQHEDDEHEDDDEEDEDEGKKDDEHGDNKHAKFTLPASSTLALWLARKGSAAAFLAETSIWQSGGGFDARV